MHIVELGKSQTQKVATMHKAKSIYGMQVWTYYDVMPEVTMM